MKVITFDGTDQKHRDMFAVLYQGFLLGTEGLVGLNAHRTATKILDRFDDISKPYIVNGDLAIIKSTGDPLRALKEEEGLQLKLEDDQFLMVEHHFSNVPWRPGISRTVVNVFELFDQASEA